MKLNEKVIGWDQADEDRRIGSRIRTVAADHALERDALASLPVDAFDPGLALTPRVDRSSLITVRMAKYSVPSRFMGRQARVSLRASELVVLDGRAVIAQHPRVVARGADRSDLDQYLEVLQIKPGALPHSTAVACARRRASAQRRTQAHLLSLRMHSSFSGASAGAGAGVPSV